MRIQSLFSSIAFLTLLCSLQAQTDDPISIREAKMPTKHAEVIEEYCLDCHDAFSEEGSVNLEDIHYNLAHDIQTAELWQKVLNVLNSGEMPPEKKKQIPNDLKASLLDDLSNQIVTARSILGDSGGIIPLRRLNRREYQNTLEDLLGFRPDVSNLPDDQAAAEFDTMGGSLFFSSDQLESYLSTAKTALSIATKKQKTESQIVRLEPELTVNSIFHKRAQDQLSIRKRLQHWFDNGKTEESAIAAGFLDNYNATKLLDQFRNYYPQISQYITDERHDTGVSLALINKQGYTKVNSPNVPSNLPGEYLIRVRAAHYPNSPARFQYIEYTKHNQKSTKRLGWKKVTGTFQKPQIIEFKAQFEPGDSKNFTLHQRSHQDRADKNIWVLDQRKNGVGTPPGVWIDWIELEGPLPKKEKGFLTQLLEQKKDVPTGQQVPYILKEFAKQAFRGKEPEQSYLDKLLEQYQSYRKTKQKHETALNNTLAIILSSPNFLYMIEENSSEKEASKYLDNFELATRLSYFLTSGPPDQQLLTAAQNGQLTEIRHLREHTERILQSPKITQFVENFSHQWLEMHRINMFSFNGVHFRNFDNATRENARQEIYAMISHIMTQKRPLKDFLISDYVMLNDLMADYYEIDSIKGDHFRKVSLSTPSPRGGILGTAAFHAMGSDGKRGSPVERGVWVLRHLMNNPPPPAPPNVPQLSRLDGEQFTPRELQKAHQEEPQCAQCHRKIDPIGYGLENFDAAGLWRTQDAFYKKGKYGYGSRDITKTFPVHATGELQDGRKFKDFFELRDIVASHSDAFAHKLVEGLITYGLGRPYGFTDHDLAQEILQKARPHGYTINECIHALIESDAFRSR